MNAKKILLRLPAILILCASWYLSSQEKVPMPDAPGSDKIVHFVCFGALAAAWSLWFPPESWKKRPAWTFFAVVLIVSLYGIADEIHQSFVPGRSCSAPDWLADTVGACAACGIRSLAAKLSA